MIVVKLEQIADDSEAANLDPSRLWPARTLKQTKRI